MRFNETPLKGSYVIDLDQKEDERGFFSRIYCKNEFAELGLNTNWIQINDSFTKHQGTVRGMHYQIQPHSEIKLVRCINGSICDIILDIRKDSSTFGQYFTFELNAHNRSMMYIPEGFAHGFQTLDNDVELIYFHSTYYNGQYERGINILDPMFCIDWPLPISLISDRDKAHQFMDKFFKGI